MMNDRSRSFVEEALAGTVDSAEAQLKSLQQCMDIIDSALQHNDSPWTPETEDDWWWTLHRLQTLQHIERVTTAQSLCNGSFIPKVYSLIRDADISSIAEDLSRNGQLDAIHTLLNLHPFSLVPCILDILSLAPETTPSKEFSPILDLLVQFSAPPAPSLHRLADWIENENTCLSLRQRGEERLVLCTEHLVKLNLGWSPPSKHALAMWIRQHALTIDRLTGQLETSIALLDVGMAVLQHSEEKAPLVDVHAIAKQLSMVYTLASSRAMSGDDVDTAITSHYNDDDVDDIVEVNTKGSGLKRQRAWQQQQRQTLLDFVGLDAVGRLRALFRLIDAENLTNHIRSTVIGQFLCHTKDAPEKILVRCLEQEAITRLPFVTTFIQLESENAIAFADNPLEVARAACAAVYATPSVDAWELQDALVHAAHESISQYSAHPPQPLASASSYRHSLDASQIDAFTSSINQVQGHLTAARILTSHGMPTAVCAVRDASHGPALDMIKMVLARVSRGRPSESTWITLWDDLVFAHDQGLQVVPMQELRIEYSRALLLDGRIKLAQKHVDLIENASKREELVLSCARDVFYAEGEADTSAMHRAKEVLRALSGSSKAVAEEAMFIDAAGKLRQLGMDMPPLQLRQTKDTSSILKRAIQHASIEALRDVDGLVDVSNALETGLRRSHVLSLVAEAALHGGDTLFAEEIALELAAEHAKDGWQVASRLALEEVCSSERNRRVLLGYCMRFAPEEELESPLLCWQASDAGASGISHAWTLPEEKKGAGESPLLVHSSGSPAAAASDASDENRYKASANDILSMYGRHPCTDDASLLLSCLLSLEPEYQELWASSIARNKENLGVDSLREAHLISLSAAALTILSTTTTTHTTTTTTTDNDDDDATTNTNSHGDSILSSRNYKNADLLYANPKDLVTLALSHTSSPPHNTTPTSPGRNTHTPHTINALRALIVELCQSIVHAADARRVTHILSRRGQKERIGVFSEADEISQKEIVLRLARAAAGGDGEGKKNWKGYTHDDNDDSYDSDGGGVIDNECIDDDVSTNNKDKNNYDTKATLEHALTLANRYKVPEHEVKLAYALSAVQHGYYTADFQEKIGVVWPWLLEYCPQETFHACLTQLYPKISGHNLDHVSYVLTLCSQSSSSAAAITLLRDGNGEKPTHATAMKAASTACAALAHAIDTFRLMPEAVNIDIKIFFDPIIQLLLLLPRISPLDMPSKDYGPCTTSSAPSHGSLSNSEKCVDQLIEYATTENAPYFALMIATVSEQQDIILKNGIASSPSLIKTSTKEKDEGKEEEEEEGVVLCDAAAVIPSTAYVAAACRELSSLTMSEGTQSDHFQKIKQCFGGMTSDDVASVAAFACLGGDSPWKQFVDSTGNEISTAAAAVAVLLTEDQSLALLNVVFDDQHAFLSFSNENDKNNNGIVHRLFIEKERLTVLLSLASRPYLQISADHLVSIEHTAVSIATVSSKEERENMLLALTSELFASGCLIIPDINAVVETLLSIVKYPALSTAHMLKNAADTCVCESLYIISSGTFKSPASTTIKNKGDDTTKVERKKEASIGDAIQNLYGVLRSLDIKCTAPYMDDDGRSTMVHAIQTHVWLLLQTYASTHHAIESAVYAEAHLQILHMFGSLGTSSMWSDWTPPQQHRQHTGLGEKKTLVDNSKNHDGDNDNAGDKNDDVGIDNDGISHAVHGAYKHTQALLHSQVTASLSMEWPGALHAAGVTADHFADASMASDAMLRVLETSNSAEHVNGVVRVLSDILSSAYPAGTIEEHCHDDNDNGSNTADDALHSLSLVAISPLHRCWSMCITKLLEYGHIDDALVALDAAIPLEDSPQPSSSASSSLSGAAVGLTYEEVQAIIPLFDAAGGVLAATAAALLAHQYKEIWQEMWGRVVRMPVDFDGDDVRGLPGSMQLLIAILHTHVNEDFLVSSLAKQNPNLFKQLCLSFLLDNRLALYSGGINDLHGAPIALNVRSGLALVAAAQLVQGQCKEAAAWVSLEHSGTHPLLKVIDSGNAALHALLHAGTRLVGAVEGCEIEESVMKCVVVGNRCRKVLQCIARESEKALLALDAM